MKKIMLLISLVSISCLANAQMPAASICEANNIRARIYSDGGNHLSSNSVSRSCVTWEVPKDSGMGTIYQQALWFGGLDASDSLHLAALRFGQGKESTDYWSGPLRVGDASTDLTTVLKYHHVWNITRAEIEQFRSNYGNNAYEIPNDILTWPAHGDEGFADYLAPFVDVNNDNRYNPADGDYPDIKGDQCLFFIFNDAFGEHAESGGGKVGLEVHCMYYAFDAPDDEALNNTVFVNYKLFNRSQNNYHNTYLGIWNDWDVGDSNDDFVGCDVRRSSCYAYNGQPEDEQYGDNVPVQVCTFLAGPYLDADGRDNPAYDGNCDNLFNSGHPLDRYGYNGFNFGNGVVDDERYGMCGFMFHNNSSNVNGDPIEAPEFYNYLRGLWRDGNPMQYGSDAYPGHNGVVGPNCKFMFPDDSDPCNFGTNGIVPNGGFNSNELFWNETQSGNVPDDRRGLATIGPFDFRSGRVQELDYAVITVWKNETQSAMERKGEFIDHIRDLFGNGFERVSHQPRSITSTKVWNGNIQVWTKGSGTKNDPYLIESAENLACLAYMVNKHFDTRDMYFRQTVDIDLNGSKERPWTPIGVGGCVFADDGCEYSHTSNVFYTSFKGHYDGGGHRISNLYVDSEEFAGLFGSVLSVMDSKTTTEDPYASISNVFLESGYVKGNETGGIVGRGGLKMDGCWNGARVEAVTRGGGLVGCGACIIHNCYNIGDVKGMNVGGVVGEMRANEGGGIAANDCEIVECYNNGMVVTADTVNNNIYAGGIAGLMLRGTLRNCYNTGNVDAISSSACGGIIGFGSTTAVENCYNIGNVVGEGRTGGIGLVSKEVSNCYYLNTCGAEGQGTPKTSEEMLDEFFVDSLNFNTDVWGRDLNQINGGYPILKNDNLHVEDQMVKGALTVYPNPAKGLFVVEGSGELTIFNVLGQQVMSRTIEEVTEIRLPGGFYLLRLREKEQTLISKIIVE